MQASYDHTAQLSFESRELTEHEDPLALPQNMVTVILLNIQQKCYDDAKLTCIHYLCKDQLWFGHFWCISVERIKRINQHAP